MMQKMVGRVWKFGHSVDTDAIVSGRYLDVSLEEAAGHVFESLRPEFASQVGQGDMIIAGENFGCGSSREQAASALKLAGIQCVAAESFGRIFFRNAVAVGLPALVCPNVHDAFEDGHRAEISLGDSRVANLSSGRVLSARPLSGEMIAILDKNGVIEYLKELAKEAP